VRVGARGDPGDQLADRALGRQLEVHPRALAVPIDDTGVGEQLQMSGDARLRLTQDLGEVGDGQLPVPQQLHDPEACLFADGTQHVEHRGGGQSHPGTI